MTLVILCALVMLVGLVGVVVPGLPGLSLIGLAALVWAWTTGGGHAWTVFAVIAVLLVLGSVIKYALPGKQLKDSGIRSTTLLFGVAGLIVGFFVIPIVGALVGFVAGVYLAEARLHGFDGAWPSTVRAIKAVLLSIVIELVTGILAIGVWGIGVGTV